MNRNNYKRRNNSSYRKYNKLTDNDINEHLINYIYNKIDVGQFKYKIIENKDIMREITPNYHLSPNYNGTNCLLVFMKIYNKFYSYMIDRKNLSYNRHQVDTNSIEPIPINIRFDKNIYNGTIIDGILLNKDKKTNKNTFIINDVYYLCGNNLLDSKTIYKNINISTFVKEKLTGDHIMNDTIIKVNKFYKLNEIKQLVDNKFNELEYSNHIKGLAFYPEISGTRLLYLYSNTAMKGYSFVETVKTEHPEISGNDDISDKDTPKKNEAVFEMRPTETMDVYKLYLLTKIKLSGKKTVKSKKMGIAYIPTKDCSVLCQSITVNKKKVLVICHYNTEKRKWVPIEESNAKRPNFIKEIY